MPFDPNDPDTKAAIKAAIDDALSAKDDEIQAIKENRDKLLKEKKELQKSATITPEQLAAVEGELETVKAKLTAAEKEAKTAKTEAEKATKALTTETSFTQRLLVENGLREALAAQNVTNPVHQKAAMAMLAGQVQVTADGDTRVAKVGDKALADFVKEWAGGDEGKHFVSAPGNGGGGAPGGSGGSGGAKTMARADFDAADQSARAAFIKEGGKVVDQAA